ncbi:MAG: UbiA family prenyltransferase [Nocardioidaceae bacterium]
MSITVPSSTRRLSMPRLALDMLRYRVAVMMWLFMLLGAAYHRVDGWPLDELLALTVALAASYIAATTVNDISDEEIDKVNHPLGRGRPLVHGEATTSDLWCLNVLASLVALGAGAYVGWRGVAVVVGALVIGYAYSVPPLLLSHRTYLATPVLTMAYVVAPYLHGLALADALPSTDDVLFASGLCSLFWGRIVLKDFRDRAGDSAFGKVTPLLRFGKAAVCGASAVGLLLGGCLLALSLGSWWMAGLVAGFVTMIALQLLALSCASTFTREQVAIGIAARMGNGMLITLLAWLLVAAEDPSLASAMGFTGGLSLVYAVAYVALARHPDDVLVGYKG